MAGIRTRAKWRRFEKEWQAILDREGVTALHMKEFAHSTGEFKAWKGDENRRRTFLADLARVIKRRTNRDFSISVFMDAYRAINSTYQFEEHVGNPYAFAAWQAILRVRRFLKRRHGDEGASLYVFEKGDAGQSQLSEVLSKNGINLIVEPIFMEKSWQEDGAKRYSLPLQAADYLAYESTKLITDLLQKAKSTARGSLMAIVDNSAVNDDSDVPNPRQYTAYGARHFEKAVREWRIPKRAKAPAYIRSTEAELIEKALGPGAIRLKSGRKSR